MPMSHELHLRCCFCGKVTDERVRVIRVEADGGGEQRMFAHTSCLRERLDPEVVPLGQAGAFGIEFINRPRRWTWTLRSVVIVGVIVVLAMLVPVVVRMLSYQP